MTCQGPITDFSPNVSIFWNLKTSWKLVFIWTSLLLCTSPQDSSVSSAILCARRVACTNGTSRSTSSLECLSVTSATSFSRRPSSCWSTKSATPSLPEGSSKESKYRQRFLTPPVPLPSLTPHPVNSPHTKTHTKFWQYSKINTWGVLVNAYLNVASLRVKMMHVTESVFSYI